MSRSAGTRLSAHPIHKKSGFCPLASLAGILLPLNNCQQYTQCYKFKLI
ncbi:Uncharacterised protein [Vibrio cholerae]|nr:Uncharacterised protein [Vibrio cholerae]